MKRKLLFFDIDGTLAMPGQEPSSALVNAIRRVRSAGHLCFLSTGRPEWLVEPNIRAIGFDGGIYHAGGRVVVGETTLLDRCMPSEMTCAVLDYLRTEPNLYFMLECAESCYRRDPGPFLAAAERSQGGSTELRRLMNALLDPSLMDEREYSGQNVYKVSYFTTNKGQMERISTVLNQYGKAVPFENMMPDEELCSGEVSAPGTDKGMAIKTVCDYYSASVADAIAFGDSMNDAEMIAAAGQGIAMGNAEPRLKGIADRCCESVAEDGVVQELKRMGLLPS